MALNIGDKDVAAAIGRGVGDELRHRRELLGLSRERFGKRLPSQLGDRTVLEYEHGYRPIPLLRLVELAEGLETPAPLILAQGLQRARLSLENTPLRVELRLLLACMLPEVLPLHRWARHRLQSSATGVVEVAPAGVRELAAAVGLPPAEVAAQLARFLPEGGR